MTRSKDVTKRLPTPVGNAVRKAVRIYERKGYLDDADIRTCLPCGPIGYEEIYKYDGKQHGRHTELDGSRLVNLAMRQHMNNVGRKGAEWTITFHGPIYDSDGRYIPMKESHRCVAIAVPKGEDPAVVLATRVIDVALGVGKPIKSIVFARMRMPSQWRFGELPVLV